jgi:putative oxidoreductase
MHYKQKFLVLEPFFLMAGRLLIAVIFLHEGFTKIANYSAASDYAEAAGVPGSLLPIAILVELGCGAMILSGIYTRVAAFLLSGFCVFTALVFHNNFADANQLLHFEKNLAMAGGLLALMVAGPGAWTLAWKIMGAQN